MALIRQQNFDTRIDETIAELNSKLGEYDKGRKDLTDNVGHCTDDTGLTDEINLDEIGDKYEELIETYNRYKTESEDRYNSIVSLVKYIIDTGIDELQQQIDTRALFQTLQGNCIELAEFITEHMDELENDMKDFNGAVTGYLTDLTKRLIACINRSIDIATIKINENMARIDFANLDRSFSDGDGFIDEITPLLAELEADSP